MSEIPESVWRDAERLFRSHCYFVSGQKIDMAEAEARTAIARAIMAERERCAKVAEGRSGEFDFAAALAEYRDSEHGFHSGRLHAARAIRSGG